LEKEFWDTHLEHIPKIIPWLEKGFWDMHLVVASPDQGFSPDLGVRAAGYVVHLINAYSSA
jgi:hypothetical protein